jgi:hypothetical protein
MACRGREHLYLYEVFARVAGLRHAPSAAPLYNSIKRMNAIHFGRESQEFCGADIAAASLAECGR